METVLKYGEYTTGSHQLMTTIKPKTSIAI